MLRLPRRAAILAWDSVQEAADSVSHLSCANTATVLQHSVVLFQHTQQDCEVVVRWFLQKPLGGWSGPAGGIGTGPALARSIRQVCAGLYPARARNPKLQQGKKKQGNRETHVTWSCRAEESHSAVWGCGANGARGHDSLATGQGWS